jgi:hypothetical protein
MRRLMRERSLKALHRRSLVPKTSDGRAEHLSLNLLPECPFPEVLDKYGLAVSLIPTY